eukprot:CAMPEP_0183466268 /NCGR_PEP_ID=MMETSP0370-20130417/148729_1 /TAXON_ID=268820 /ORGANISM="Peridinium aciculiferum, Strain PAER-2" /LENGTH=55 /DNA_ID=CAMNT_0025658533 /DNA_START=1 /DNA_END=165 /DNA_ORIENTATION=+
MRRKSSSASSCCIFASTSCRDNGRRPAAEFARKIAASSSLNVSISGSDSMSSRLS